MSVFGGDDHNQEEQQFELLDMITIFSLCLDIDNRFENNRAIIHQRHIEDEINDIQLKVTKILKLLEEKNG